MTAIELLLQLLLLKITILIKNYYCMGAVPSLPLEVKKSIISHAARIQTAGIFNHPYSLSLAEWVRALHTASRLGALNSLKPDEKKGHS